jgi:hypothetical protein
VMAATSRLRAVTSQPSKAIRARCHVIHVEKSRKSWCLTKCAAFGQAPHLGTFVFSTKPHYGQTSDLINHPHHNFMKTIIFQLLKGNLFTLHVLPTSCPDRSCSKTSICREIGSWLLFYGERLSRHHLDLLIQC